MTQDELKAILFQCRRIRTNIQEANDRLEMLEEHIKKCCTPDDYDNITVKQH